MAKLTLLIVLRQWLRLRDRKNDCLVYFFVLPHFLIVRKRDEVILYIKAAPILSLTAKY